MAAPRLRDYRTSDQPKGAVHGRRRATRPRFDSLEGRALMAYSSAVDPTFTPPAISHTYYNGTAVAVQDDGKVVEAMNTGDAYFFGRYAATITVSRFNVDGSLDTTFGTSGKTVIPLPSQGATGSSPSSYVVEASQDLLIKSDGSIAFAEPISVYQNGAESGISNTLVVQLTPNGQLDPAFGTGGEVLIANSNEATPSAALQPDGKLLVLSGNYDTSGSLPTSKLILTRFNANGTLDTTFNGTGTATITYEANPIAGYEPAAVAVDPTSGRIDVAGNVLSGVALVQLNPNGTLNTGFGTGGTLLVAQPPARIS